MELVTMVVILGLAGGVYVAYWLAKLNHETPRPPQPVSPRYARLDTDMINMAHIRVAGVGGLGLVGMAIVVALTIPGVGVPVGAGLVFGVAFGAWLIARRKKLGPMPSSGQRPGANVVLAIDEPEPPSSEREASTPPTRPMDLSLRPSL